MAGKYVVWKMVTYLSLNRRDLNAFDAVVVVRCEIFVYMVFVDNKRS